MHWQQICLTTRCVDAQSASAIILILELGHASAAVDCEPVWTILCCSAEDTSQAGRAYLNC